MRLERQAGEHSGEVTRTYLAGSTRPVNGLGKAFRLIRHTVHLPLNLVILSAVSREFTVSGVFVD